METHAKLLLGTGKNHTLTLQPQKKPEFIHIQTPRSTMLAAYSTKDFKPRKDLQIRNTIFWAD